MTGDEHYREAARLLKQSEFEIAKAGAAGDNAALQAALEVAPVSLAAAQVHATLALAAAGAAARCADRDSFGQRCHLEAGHDGQHSIPIPTAERAWA